MVFTGDNQHMRKQTIPPPHLKGEALVEWLKSESEKAFNSQQAHKEAVIAEAVANPLVALAKRPQFCDLIEAEFGPDDPPNFSQTPITSENRGIGAVASATAMVSVNTHEVNSTSVSCLQEYSRDSNGVFQGEYKREYKDAYKSDTRAEAGTQSDPCHFPQQNPTKEELEREHSAGLAWLLLDEQLRKISKKAKPFRNRFELARLAKFAVTLGISYSKVRSMAAELMIPWCEIEELTSKVRRQPNENLFEMAIQQGSRNVSGLEKLDPALHKVAALAFQLQTFAGSETIYLVQSKVAQAFGTNQSTISRVIKHLKDCGWLVEVSREKKTTPGLCALPMSTSDKDFPEWPGKLPTFKRITL